jgi:hypothetical protein
MSLESSALLAVFDLVSTPVRASSVIASGEHPSLIDFGCGFI